MRELSTPSGVAAAAAQASCRSAGAVCSAVRTLLAVGWFATQLASKPARTTMDGPAPRFLQAVAARPAAPDIQSLLFVIPLFVIPCQTPL
ncbi:hypothetical protein MesoLjLb_11110 [Mesorhizobium sp. L-8-3]|nr:hypothetical protein MesoLjLb_11110 [Mesorhizobium sp. L-8-3]